LVKGGDYTEDTIVGADFVKSKGGRVEVIPFLDGFSTSKIIEKIIKLHCQKQK
jgi:D-beta-D-heptose 7-phosphate kinase/D-beta-D-heptose 1-phosphate adenosyltransferase